MNIAEYIGIGLAAGFGVFGATWVYSILAHSMSRFSARSDE